MKLPTTPSSDRGEPYELSETLPLLLLVLLFFVDIEGGLRLESSCRVREGAGETSKDFSLFGDLPSLSSLICAGDNEREPD